MRGLGSRLWLVAALAIAAPKVASADPVADFYAGKTVRIIIGYGEGGGYDLYGRLGAEFLGRYIPGKPTVIAQNMPGAGSFLAANYLYAAAPQDGTILGSVSQTLAMDAAIDEKSTLDVMRIPYIGRFTNNIDVGVALPQTGIKSIEDARRREVIVGMTGRAATTVVIALELNRYGGAKFKLVRGYKGNNEIELAAERGEIEVAAATGLPHILASHPDWISKHKAVILYQNALSRDPVIPDVPTLPELALTNEGRAVMRVVAGTAEIGRSLITTPGTPPERVAALRKAFKDMVSDPEFLAACKKRNVTIVPGTAEEMEAIVRETMQLPKPVLQDLRAMLKG